MGAAIKPRRQTINIDGGGCRKVLQASFWQSPIAILPQSKGADALRERPFDTCSLVVLGFPFLRALLLPYSLEGLMLDLRAQGQMTGRRLCLGAQRTTLTVPTVLVGELDAHDGILPPILARAPCGAGFAPGAGHLLGLPVDVELTEVIGLLVLCLPGDIGTDRADERNREVPRTLHEQGRVHVASIDN